MYAAVKSGEESMQTKSGVNKELRNAEKIIRMIIAMYQQLKGILV